MKSGIATVLLFALCAIIAAADPPPLTPFLDHIASTVDLTDSKLRSLAASGPTGFVASLERPALSDPWHPASDR